MTAHGFGASLCLHQSYQQCAGATTLQKARRQMTLSIEADSKKWISTGAEAFAAFPSAFPLLLGMELQLHTFRPMHIAFL